MTDERDDDYEIPRRPNGQERVFWYDPAYPRHIMHNRKGSIGFICVGHQD